MENVNCQRCSVLTGPLHPLPYLEDHARYCNSLSNREIRTSSWLLHPPWDHKQYCSHFQAPQFSQDLSQVFKMAGLKDLPIELQGTVASFLDTSDLKSLCLVNKDLRKSTEEYIYDSISNLPKLLSTATTVISNDAEHYGFLCRSHLLLRSLQSLEHLRKQVRYLSIAPGLLTTDAARRGSRLTLRDSTKLSKDFETFLQRYTELGVQHRRRWAEGVMDGNFEALYAAVAFLCHNMHRLHLDLKHVRSGRYFEILGHLASIPKLHNRGSVCNRLSFLALTNLSNNSQSKAENSARATRLTPLAFIHGVEGVYLGKFDIKPMSNHVLRSTIAGSAITTPHKALSARAVCVGFFDLMDDKRQNQRDVLYRGLRDWTNRFSEIQQLYLDLRSTVLCRPVQGMLNRHRSSLVYIDLMRSLPSTGQGSEQHQNLSFNSFARLKILKVNVELMYPDRKSILHHGDASAVEVFLSRLPETLDSLTLCLSTAQLDICANLIALIIKSGKLPNLKAVEADLFGDVQTHFSNTLGHDMIVRSPQWDSVAIELWEKVEKHVASMFKRWEGTVGRGVDLIATLSEIVQSLQHPRLTPYTIYPSKDTQDRIVERIVSGLMASLTDPPETQI